MHYSDWKVAILGFGVEGKDAARYFLGQKSIITVFDKKSKSEIVKNEWENAPLTWRTGPDYLKKGLGGFDLIVRSPGFYRFMPEIVEAEKSGIKVTSNTNLFFEESEARIVGITGTKGKGTTARMLQLGLRQAGFTTLLLGNIGEPMLDRIVDADTFDWVILELSSFQLIDLKASPSVAVVTNITTDHLNWHKDRNEYIRSKENLWKYQTKDGPVIFNRDDETSRELAESAPGQVLWFSTKNEVEKGTFVRNGQVFIRLKRDILVGSTNDLSVPGEHTLLDALAALVAASVAGADPKTAWEGITSYKGAEHRLEKVAEIEEVLYINDSAATTPEAAIGAVKSFPQPKVLIAGGSLKGVTFEALAESIKGGNVKRVIAIGEAAVSIEDSLQKVGYRGEIVTGLEDMGSVVAVARRIVKPGDVVLFSPGCASFGLFTDYKDRGKKFKEAVLNLKN